ncbi:MAG: hypothetical protein ACHQJD_02265 [Thermoanaerobaculia bacterium]
MTSFVLRRVRVGAALFLSAPLLAQAPPGAPTPRAGVTATEEVTVLTLDVMAVDGRNRPVFGLVPADFEVRVAGKVQTIDLFEPPRVATGRADATKEGRPDSEERIAGTTTPFEARGAVRHVLVWADLEQLPRRSILDTAEALHKAFDHAPSGRYGLATHFGGTSARIWDADSVDALLMEADRMGAEVTENPEGASAQVPGSSGMVSEHGADSLLQYESRTLYEKQLIDDLIRGVSGAIPAISAYLAAERRRTRTALQDLRETAERFSALEGPRHLFFISEGFERVPGFNFLARLQAEEAAAGGPGSSAGRALAGGSGFPAIPGAPGSGRDLGANRFAFDSGPLFEADDLDRWFAASGVILHFIDPGSLGRGLLSAEDKYAFSSTLRQDDAKNLQETPLRYASDTGGLARLTTNDVGKALTDLLDATTATYRIGVRLQGVDPKKTYSVKVSTRKAGVNMLARSAYQPGPRKAQAAASLAADAGRASLAARVDEARPGAARLAKRPLPVVLDWKGRSTLSSKDPAKPFWTLDVKIPHEALTFRPEEDAMLASVQIAVEAVSLDGPLRDSFSDDWFLSYSGPEYKEARDQDAVRGVTLQLPPGRWELKVSVHDALGDTFGSATVRVEAPR